MKWVLIVAGCIAAAVGVAICLGQLGYTRNEEVVKLGGFSATVQEQQTVPQWAGVAAIVLGGVLVVGGLVSKR